MILNNLLANEKSDKSNYRFRSFYDLPENSPYIQSELFYRKTVSQLNYNSNLSFLFLQLNSGSGKDYLTNAQHYKIKLIPLIEIKYHLLQEYFYTYFFTYNSNNKIMALNNVNTLILSFNESKDIGYTEPHKLTEISDENNMIKLAFLKFKEHAHIKFNDNYTEKLDPRYLLSGDFKLIDNKFGDKKEEKGQFFHSGESGNALEYFIFNDYFTLDKLMKSKEELTPLNNINLLTQNNFDELRKLAEELTKNVQLDFSYNQSTHINEIIKKYDEKIRTSVNLKNKSLSKIKYYDLDIEEIY